ncbi:MAG: CZB domain-containing protein [Burkholderiaceae bacterium]|jgi:hypothetical protein|nr:CZB domain-containing protein [Burkholderiaceae bacterium]
MFGFSFRREQESDNDFARAMAQASDSLDIQVAISAHENWKIRLHAYLDGTSSEAFNPDVICFDDRCDLGQWIHGPGRERLGKFPGFTALVDNHKMFHYAASNVVALSQRGKTSEAHRILEGQFQHFSNQVVGILSLLQKARANYKSK